MGDTMEDITGGTTVGIMEAISTGIMEDMEDITMGVIEVIKV